MRHRLWYVLIVLAAIAGFGLVGCTDETNVSDTGTDAIKAQSEAIFTGQVLDVLDKPMQGVTVVLYASEKYVTSTDEFGNYIIRVSLGDVMATPGGGTGHGDEDSDLDEDPDLIYRVFPMEIAKDGFATLRNEVYFEGEIGYTDGSGAVVLLSQVGQYIPTVWLVPYVDNFEFTVYAGTDVAPYATVNLMPDWFDDWSWWYYDYGTYYENSGWFETGYIQLHADENGVVKITAEDKVPAQEYFVFAAPYDVDGDGIFEYDASMTTQPWGGFDLEITPRGDGLIDLIYDATSDTYEMVQTELAPSVLLTDASGKSDVEVVYYNLQNMENIPQAQSENLQLVVMLSRPIIIPGGFDYNLLFKLERDDGSIVPLELVSSTGNYLFVLEPMTTLTPSGNEYEFYVMLNKVVAYDGAMAGDTFCDDFNIYDPDATALAAITPGIDLQGRSFGTADSYLVDWDDIWLGDEEDGEWEWESSDWIQDRDEIRLSWAVPEEAYGYQVWVRDSDTEWQQVPGFAVTYTYNDGLFIEARIEFGGDGIDIFNAWDLEPSAEIADPIWENFAPFFAGNVMQIVVMPENINGYAQDPNSDPLIVGLRLEDNVGPVISENGWFWGDYIDFDDDTEYDETGLVIPFQEPLAAVNLTRTTADGTGYGAWAKSGYFRVTDVYWDDEDLTLVDGEGTPYPSNHAYIVIDLEPTVSTALEEILWLDYDTLIQVDADAVKDFAILDKVEVGDNYHQFVHYIDSSGRIGLNGDHVEAEAGDAVCWVGPMQEGYDSVETYTSGRTDSYYDVIIVEDATGIYGDYTRLTAPEDVRVDSIGGYYCSMAVLDLYDDLTAAYDQGDPVTGYTIAATVATVTGDDLVGDNQVTVSDGAAVYTGTREIMFLTDDPFFAYVQSRSGNLIYLNKDLPEKIPNGTEILLVGATETYVDGAASAGDTTIDVDDASDLAAGDKIVFNFAGTPVVAEIASVDANELTLTAGLADDVGDNVTVQKCIDFATELACGFPGVALDSTKGAKVGSTITFNPDGDSSFTATVVGVSYIYGSPGVAIDSMIVDGESNPLVFADNVPVSIDSSREADVLQVKVKDRSGNDSFQYYDEVGYDEDGCWDAF